MLDYHRGRVLSSGSGSLGTAVVELLRETGLMGVTGEGRGSGVVATT